MDDTHKFPVLQGHPEEDKAKELRKNMISTVESLNLEMGCSGTMEEDKAAAEKEVDEFIAAVEVAQRARLLQKLLAERNKEESESMRLEREAALFKVQGAFAVAENKERQATRHAVLAQGITTAGAALGYDWAELHPFSIG
jgi:hypothetical protein